MDATHFTAVQAALLAGLLAHSITDPALALRGSDVVDGLRALNTVIGDR